MRIFFIYRLTSKTWKHFSGKCCYFQGIKQVFKERSLLILGATKALSCVTALMYTQIWPKQWEEELWHNKQILVVYYKVWNDKAF